MKKISLFSIFLFLFFLPGYSFAGKLNIYVSILPQKYFAEKIGMDKIEVDVMVLPGHSPATYNPKPSQMADLAKAEIYFSIGVPFEKKWISKLSKNFKNLEIIDSGHGITKREIDEKLLDFHHDHEEEDHHDGHHHGFYDPHIWMSPVNAIKIARNMLTGIMDKDPENKDFYISNYENFVKECASVDSKLIKLSNRILNKKVFVFHPSWGYFMDDYGLIQIPVEYQGKEPSPKYLSKLIAYAGKNGIKTLLIQPQFPSSSIKVMEKTLNLKVFKADPLAYDWSDNLISIANIIRQN